MKFLEKKTDECVRVVFAIMSAIADNLLGDYVFFGFDERKRAEVLLEFLSYHLYCLNRIYFERLGREDKNELSEAVFREVHSYLMRTCKFEQSAFLKTFPELYKKRAAEYDNYQNIPVDSPWGFKGVLEWEFASRISAMLESPNDPDRAFAISRLNHIWIDHTKFLEKVLLEGQDDTGCTKDGA